MLSDDSILLFNSKLDYLTLRNVRGHREVLLEQHGIDTVTTRHTLNYSGDVTTLHPFGGRVRYESNY
jgi:hypothetical protein